MTPLAFDATVCRFAEIAGCLDLFGWQVTRQARGVRPGEPEFADFAAGDAERLTTTLDPVFDLRLVRPEAGLSAADWMLLSQALREALPCLDSAAVGELLASSHAVRRGRGVLAAEALGAAEHRRALEPLAGDTDPYVAAAARRAIGTLERVRADPRRSPDATVFAALPTPEARRQVLRWLCRDRALTPSAEAVLHRALSDPDAETRVTAVLASVRLEAARLAEAVARCKLPDTTAQGAWPADRSFYRMVQRRAAACLSGVRDEGCARLLALTRGEAAVESPHDLLLHALSTPTPAVDPPEQPPKAVEMGPEGPRLRRSGVALCWVPPVPHWRGGVRPADDDDAAVRQETPPPALFLARSPLSTAEARRWLPDLPGVEHAVAALTAEEAERVAARAAAEEDGEVGLVDSAAWSMALHGPDGRMFPWGHSLRPTGRESPWRAVWTEAAEWISTPDGLVVRAVGARGLSQAERAAVRLMVKGQP